MPQKSAWTSASALPRAPRCSARPRRDSRSRARAERIIYVSAMICPPVTVDMSQRLLVLVSPACLSAGRVCAGAGGGLRDSAASVKRTTVCAGAESLVVGAHPDSSKTHCFVSLPRWVKVARPGTLLTCHTTSNNFGDEMDALEIGDQSRCRVDAGWGKTQGHGSACRGIAGGTGTHKKRRKAVGGRRVQSMQASRPADHARRRDNLSLFFVLSKSQTKVELQYHGKPSSSS